jgi:TRAP-type transport system small permease protein
MITLIETIESLLMRLGVASGIATLLITVVVVVDVAGRAIFNNPIHGATELAELLLVAMVFFGLAAAQQGRQNYSIDIATRHLPAFLQALVELLGYIVSLAIVAVLAWLSTKQAFVSFERGEAGFGIIPFPIWPARFVLAVGFWLLALQFVCDILRHLVGQPRISTQASNSGSHE